MGDRPSIDFNPPAPTACSNAARSLSPAFYARTVLEFARALIGTQLLVGGVGGRVVETDAAAADGIALHVVNLPVAKRGFVLLPRRWVVERSLCLGDPLPQSRAISATSWYRAWCPVLHLIPY